MSSRERILVICPTDWERTAFAAPELQDKFEFILCGEELFEAITLWKVLRFEVHRYLDRIVAKYQGSGIAGVLGTGDYPGCMFSAYVAERLQLPAPSSREIVLLSHKYYSRERQRDLVPEATPAFEVLDPRAGREPQELSYPFFVKPVKGTMSIRAQMVHDREELRSALSLTLRERTRAWALLRPFSQLLKSYEKEPVPANFFIAEAPLSGVQVTVDGFVQGGRVTVMGIVDSIMYPGTMSFQRFEYPSSLPPRVQERMADITTRLMGGGGFDHSCFNLELFYNAQQDSISIIELNPRMSYQFSDLFARVDGKSSFAVQLALATGVPVDWPRGQGSCQAAASFVMRRFRDARVRAVPDAQQLDVVARRYPDTQVKLLCAPGDCLSDHDQDVGSYRYCIVNMAAPSSPELHAAYAEVERLLPFDFAELPRSRLGDRPPHAPRHRQQHPQPGQMQNHNEPNEHPQGGMGNQS